MAENCKNCGAQLPENAGFCAVCGTPAENSAQPAYAAQPQFPQQSYAVPQPVAEEKKPNKNIIIIGAVALVAIIAIIAVIAGVAGAGYKKPIKAMAQSFEDADFDMFVDSILEDKIDYFGDEETLELGFKVVYDYLEDECGKDYKVKVEYNGKEKLNEDEIEEWCEDMEEEGIEYDEDDMENLYIVDVVLTAEGDDGEAVILDGELYVSKCDGEWVVVFYEEFEFECEDDMDAYYEENAEKYYYDLMNLYD